MRKTKFIFTLMLGVSMATMAKADDTSYDNCVKAVGADNCVQIKTSGTYYALSGPAGNQTMTIYGTTEEGSAAAEVPNKAFYNYNTNENRGESTLDANIKSLKTEGSVNIGKSAFMLATSLTSVDLTGVQKIGDDAFGSTKNLESVKLDGVQTIGGGAFNHSGLKGYLDLSGVESIGKGAFTLATSLTSVNLSGVQEIGHNAFTGTGLTSVNLTGVQSIKGGAFRSTGLTSVVLPDSFFNEDGSFKSDISPYAFTLSSVSTIYLPQGVCSENTDCVGYFKDCTQLMTNDTCRQGETSMFSQSNFKTYKIENGQIKVGGKTYASLNDLANGNHIKKRIYTLKEANEVTGPVNRISIKYR